MIALVSWGERRRAMELRQLAQAVALGHHEPDKIEEKIPLPDVQRDEEMQAAASASSGDFDGDWRWGDG